MTLDILNECEFGLNEMDDVVVLEVVFCEDDIKVCVVCAILVII